MSKLTTITAANGITYNVRLVEEGDRHGLNMCRVHDKPGLISKKVEPMVEFYDTRSQFHYDFVGEPEAAKAAGAVCLGQHAASYFVSSLLENIAVTGGIQLQGHVPSWVVDGDSLRKAFIDLGLWNPPAPPKKKLVVVWDSNDPDTEPTVWAPRKFLDQFEVHVLNKSQEHGGRFPNTDPADITLLEAGVNAAFPDYIQLP